jgi:beta-lactamase regulating signal transducer with metallopeptidase domain
MTSLAIAQYAPRALVLVAEPALRSIVLACLATLVLAGLRVRHVNLHLAVWTGVLYGALAMPLVVWLMPSIPLQLQVPAHQVAPITSTSSAGNVIGYLQFSRVERTGRVLSTAGDGRSAGVSSTRTGEGSRHASLGQPHSRSERQGGVAAKLLLFAAGVGRAPGRSFSPLALALALGVYVFGLMVLLGQLVVGFILGRRLRQNSRRVDDPRALRWLERQATAMGLERPPILAESPSVSVPLTLGVLRPVIVIPSGWREWESAKLAAVIAHEVSHVRRNDSRTRALALLYRCLFWFSPLGWWLERRLTELAEQASDQAAICAGAEPIFYAEVLMSFFDISTRQGRVKWQGVSMAHGVHAKRRIERILSSGSPLPATMKRRVLLLVALCALPMVWLTAATRPVMVVNPSSAKLVAAGQAVADPRVPEPPQQAHDEHSQLLSHITTVAGEDAWLMSYLSPSDHADYILNYRCDAREPEDALRKKFGDSFILFNHGGNSYLIRDAPTVKAAYSAAVAPDVELIRDQSALSRQQQALQRQQEVLLGDQRGPFRVELPSEFESRLRKVAEEIRELGSTATPEDLGRLQNELGDIQGYIGELQGKAGEQQKNLGSRQSELEAQQSELARKRIELGKEQDRVRHEAFRKMQEILKQALESGVARPLSK